MTTELSHHEAVQYLRDAAIRAHLDGQGAKARQLAAIALRKEANRGVIPIVNLEDLAWAFFLIIYWMIEEEDFSIVLDGAWESFNKKQQQEKKIATIAADDEDWRAIIRFFMDALMPNGSEWEADRKSLEEIPRSFFKMRKDQYTNEVMCMILPLVIDFLHYLYPDKIKNGHSEVFVWHSLSCQWASYAATEKNEDLRKSLDANRKRIEKQHACLVEPGTFPYHAENALEELWDAFYKVDVDRMKNALPELTKLAHKDEDKFYPVQSLINLTRFTIGWDTDQFPGVYRIQRLYMENPQWLFSRLRLMKFSEVLNDAYFEIRQEKPAGAKAVQIWRWPLVSEIIALQNWDLGNYLNSIKMQSEAWLFLGLFTVDHKTGPLSDDAAANIVTSIYQAIKGITLNDLKSRHFSDIRRAFFNLELNESATTRIEGLLGSILKSVRPIEFRSAVNLFSIMSDAIPKNEWENVLKISIEAFSAKNIGTDWKMLNWWEDAFKWVDLDRTVWDIVDPLLTNFFDNPFHWNVSNAMLKEALINAPKDLAEKWANIIAESRSKEDLHEYGMSIIYNASLRRPDLKDYALRVLDFLKDDPALTDEMAYDRALLLAVKEDKDTVSQVPAGKKLRAELVEKLLQYAQSVADRKTKPTIRIGGLPFQWRPFQRVSWSKLGLSQWNRIDRMIKPAIENPYSSEGDFISLILVWSIIASQQEKRTIDEEGRWMIDLCRKFKSKKEHIPGTDGPFSRMSIISDLKDSSRFVLIVALSHFLHKVSQPVADDMLFWIQDEIPETEEANLPTLWEMLCALYITGTHAQSIWTLNALKAIYARTASDSQLLTRMSEKTYDVLITTDRKKGGNRLVDILRHNKNNDVGPILNTLDKVMGKIVQAPHPDGRRAVAMVLNLLNEMGWRSEQHGKWIENLKRDPRARVSSVFQE
jgi:hypothetical protein